MIPALSPCAKEVGFDRKKICEGFPSAVWCFSKNGVALLQDGVCNCVLDGCQLSDLPCL